MAEPSRLWFELGVGMLSSIVLAAGLAMMKSRGEALPVAEGRAILSAVIRWCRDPVWIGGLGVQVVGYSLYFAALAAAPISLVSVMTQGGIAVFVLIAIIFLHERANTGEWVGIVSIILAMILLGLSLSGGAAYTRVQIFPLTALSGLLLLASGTPWMFGKLRLNGAAPALASGVAFGLASLYTKALADAFAANAGGAIVRDMLISPWFWLTVVTNITGLVLLQNSFHSARGIITMPLSTAVSNIVPIGGGIIAFGESMPAQPWSATLRIAAFAITIAGSALLAGAEATAELPAAGELSEQRSRVS